MSAQKIIIHQNTAEIWVTSDSDSSTLQLDAKTLTEQGYKVVIYRSGHQNLLPLTEQLLLYAVHPLTHNAHGRHAPQQKQIQQR